MADKNFLRIDKFPATGHIESIVSDTEELLAGQFVLLGTVLETSEGEEVSYENATAGGEYDAIVAPVYTTQNELNPDIVNKSIPAGQPARALIVQKGDVVSINSENADLEVGTDVQVGPNGLGFEAHAGEGVKVGKVIAREFYPNVGELTVIRFA